MAAQVEEGDQFVRVIYYMAPALISGRIVTVVDYLLKLRVKAHDFLTD